MPCCAGRIRFVCWCEHWWSRASARRSSFFLHANEIFCVCFFSTIIIIILASFEIRVKSERLATMNGGVKDQTYDVLYIIYSLFFRLTDSRCIDAAIIYN